jgi:hypothetical protein
MNEELQKALKLLRSQVASNIEWEPGDGDRYVGLDEVDAAEAAVVAIFEAREDPQLLTAVHMMGAAEAGAELREMKTLAKQLAGALRATINMALCDACYYPSQNRPTCSPECASAAMARDAALAAYAELEAKG